MARAGTLRPRDVGRRAARVALGLWLACAASACRIARPSDLPRDQDWIVAVKSCRLPERMPWYTRFAQHSWIDVKQGDEERWRRIEVSSASSGVRNRKITADTARRDRRWSRDVRLVEQISGDDARRVAEKIEAAAERRATTFAEDYEAWPGPNSNTFIEDLAEEIPELRFALHHNAVGKDYPGWFEAGATASGTGVHVDTLPLGFALGLEEGIEIHFLQLTFGLALFPPRLELPFLPELPWPAAVESQAEEAPAAGSLIQITFTEEPGSSSTRRFGVQLPAGDILVEFLNAEHTWVLLHYEVAPATGELTCKCRWYLSGQEQTFEVRGDLAHGAVIVIENADLGLVAVTVGLERVDERSMDLVIHSSTD